MDDEQSLIATSNLGTEFGVSKTKTSQCSTTSSNLGTEFGVSKTKTSQCSTTSTQGSGDTRGHFVFIGYMRTQFPLLCHV